MKTSLRLLALALAALAPRASAQLTVGLGFDGCGTMVQGVECVLFQADSGALFVLNSPVAVDLGDRLHVVGTTDPTCITTCQQGACLNATLVEDCSPGDVVCPGNGGDQLGCTDCPCGNDAPADARGGCINGVGSSARLIASGVPNPLDDQLHFDVHGANPSTFAVLLSGAELLPTNPLNPCPAGSGIRSALLDGLRCVGVGLQRHGVRATDAEGDVGLTNNGWGGGDPPAIGLIAQGGFQLGQTRHWQVFYREASALVCMRGLNTTNAVSTILFPVVPAPLSDG